SLGFQSNLVGSQVRLEIVRPGHGGPRGGAGMVMKHLLGSAIVATGLSVLLFTWVVARPDAQPAPPSAQIDADDIGGGAPGPRRRAGGAGGGARRGPGRPPVPPQGAD